MTDVASHCPTQLQDTIIKGDALRLFPCVKDESIDLIFTSPPYFNARPYSHWKTYRDYLTDMETTFQQAHRILKEGRYFVVNVSPVIIPRTTRSDQSTRIPIPFHFNELLERNGFEFIDDIIWEKPNPSTKNRNAGFWRHRQPLAYKPNSVTEYVLVYRKKTDKLLDWTLRQVDGTRLAQSRVTDDHYEKTNLWRISPAHRKDHPAAFPEKLAENVINFYSVVGDTVLDPFNGSGTTTSVAKRSCRHFIGFEKQADFAQSSKKRLQETPLCHQRL